MSVLNNHTVLPAFMFDAVDLDDVESCVVVCRGTFDFDNHGRVVLSQSQDPLVLADSYYDDAHNSSLKCGSDVCPQKRGCDLSVVGIATSPENKKVSSWTAVMTLGELSVKLRLSGPRRWVYANWSGWKLTPAEPVSEVSLRYENSFGGRYRDRYGKEIVCDSNPVGVGFVSPDLLKKDECVVAPQIESVENPIARLGEVFDPVGFGPIPPHWSTRSMAAGTADNTWLSNRWPLRPRDFSINYYNTAPAALVYPTTLQGGECMVLEGFLPDGALKLLIPKVSLRYFAFDARANFNQGRLLIDTLQVDLEQKKLRLVWRQRFCKKNTILGLYILQDTPSNRMAIEGFAKSFKSSGKTEDDVSCR